jgi:hypothetical protein
MNYNQLDSKLLMPTRLNSLQVVSNWKQPSYKQKAHSHHDQVRSKKQNQTFKKKTNTQTRGIAWKNNFKDQMEQCTDL